MDIVCGALPRHTRRTWTRVVVLTLLAVVLAGSAFTAGPASAAGKPGKPVAKAPKGTVATAKPVFAWGKAARATSYEVQVYRGSKLVVKKAGLNKLSWTCTKTLPASTALTWKVRGKNARGAGAWSKKMSFRVATPPPPSPAKAITAFSFQGLAPPVTGDIDEAAHTIGVTVPFGTDPSALVATFTTTGASVAVGGAVQTSGVTANDFGSPVTYTVTAADGTTQDYVVTVDVAPSPAKAITAFSFQGRASGHG